MMRVKWWGLGLLLLVLSCQSSSQSTFKIVKPSQHRLSNGMRVFALEDPSLPTFRLSLLHPAGAIREATGQQGLAEITAETVRTGGTKQKTPLQVDQLIHEASGRIEMGAARESAWVSLNVLKEDRQSMLQLLQELLQTPGFDTRAFELARRQSQVALRRSHEKPEGLSSLYFSGELYGTKSPWAAVPTQSHLQALTVEQAKTFYQRHYRPEWMWLAVAGDFKTTELIKELEATLGQWKLPAVGKITWPEITPQPQKIVFMPLQAEQVALRLGHVSLKRDHPDKYAILLANFILGGSGAMTSRLGEEIRSNQGKAYSVWSRFGFGRAPGIFEMIAQTEASQFQDVISEMKKILKHLQAQGVTEAELADAKAAILRSLLFEYESRYAIAKDWARFAFRGYPDDYLTHFAAQIEKVSMQDVNRVLKKHFKPEQLSIMIVGSESLWPQIQSKWPEAKRKLIP